MVKNRVHKSVLVASIAIALSGCQTIGGVQRLQPLETSLASHAAGHGLKPAALRAAANAEAKTLEGTPTGAVETWSSGGSVTGSIMPGQPFEVSGRLCRRYSHKIIVNGNSTLRDATACKGNDNIWHPI